MSSIRVAKCTTQDNPLKQLCQMRRRGCERTLFIVSGDEATTVSNQKLWQRRGAVDYVTNRRGGVFSSVDINAMMVIEEEMGL